MLDLFYHFFYFICFFGHKKYKLQDVGTMYRELFNPQHSKKTWPGIQTEQKTILNKVLQYYTATGELYSSSAQTRIEIVVQGTYGFLHDVFSKQLYSMKGYRYVYATAKFFTQGDL